MGHSVYSKKFQENSSITFCVTPRTDKQQTEAKHIFVVQVTMTVTLMEFSTYGTNDATLALE